MDKMDCCCCRKSLTADEDGVCCVCGQPVCDNCIRVPDPDVYSTYASNDYCLKCYVEAGFGENWTVNYYTAQGDNGSITFDVAPGTLSFKIPGMAKSLVPMWGGLISFRKEKSRS